MEGLYDRTERLVGTPAAEKLINSRVLVVGLGGVGGHLMEALVRAGIGTIGICDFDTVDETNLNRQLLSLKSTVGRLKTEVADERSKDINPSLKTEVFSYKLTMENLDSLHLESWDFIADAIDDVPVKLEIMERAYKAGVPVISSMGTGNKLDPFTYKIVPIEKTDTDPLAKSIRRQLKERGVKGIPVLYSTENPKVSGVQRSEPMPSISYMPAIAGMMIASYVIRELIKQE